MFAPGPGRVDRHLHAARGPGGALQRQRGVDRLRDGRARRRQRRPGPRTAPGRRRRGRPRPAPTGAAPATCSAALSDCTDRAPGPRPRPPRSVGGGERVRGEAAPSARAGAADAEALLHPHPRDPGRGQDDRDQHQLRDEHPAVGRGEQRRRASSTSRTDCTVPVTTSATTDAKASREKRGSASAMSSAGTPRAEHAGEQAGQTAQPDRHRRDVHDRHRDRERRATSPRPACPIAAVLITPARRPAARRRRPRPVEGAPPRRQAAPAAAPASAEREHDADQQRLARLGAQRGAEQRRVDERAEPAARGVRAPGAGSCPAAPTATATAPQVAEPAEPGRRPAAGPADQREHRQPDGQGEARRTRSSG